MNLFNKIIDKLYLKQWSIGVADISIEKVIQNKKIDSEFIWFPINNNFQFFADPFIYKNISDEYCILYEELDYRKQYGYISEFTLNKKNEIISKKIQLDTNSHLSYPFIFFENDRLYVFPESSAIGKLSCFQYDQEKKMLKFEKDILDLPLLDSTILKHENKYWIFCTMRGEDSNKKLYIFYADSLLGSYKPHAQNPVKDNINGSRPAGNFIVIGGNIYRPAQNSGKYYGSSIAITKIVVLNETEFIEEDYMTLIPGKKESFNFGIHTINYQDDLIVIDGLRRIFAPLTQITTFIKKKLK